eukprot:TRINITY_DN12644_c0_g1_i1.p1 TRINITY_DN12644_c0_g1~~TRINITY_DN12644_c0_g1_i1.p1  ORF type:complete len:236 (-),score=46.35 TRINITY_DN12644_c0_g1_i1:333-1040(-)
MEHRAGAVATHLRHLHRFDSSPINLLDAQHHSTTETVIIEQDALSQAPKSPIAEVDAESSAQCAEPTSPLSPGSALRYQHLKSAADHLASVEGNVSPPKGSPESYQARLPMTEVDKWKQKTFQLQNDLRKAHAKIEEQHNRIAALEEELQKHRSVQPSTSDSNTTTAAASIDPEAALADQLQTYSRAPIAERGGSGLYARRQSAVGSTGTADLSSARYAVTKLHERVAAVVKQHP